MKKRMKVLALLGCAVMLVAGSILGTIAFLTAEETITNTFTVGKVSFGDEENGVDALDEALVDEYGVADASGKRTDSNAFKLIPDHQYTKDPTIHINKDSEECYLFVTVTNGISSIEAETESGVYKNIAEQMKANGWNQLNTTEYKDVYVYSEKVSGEEVEKATDDTKGNTTLDIKIFENFKIKKNVEQSHFESLVGDSVADDKKAKIIINAFAVQAEGFTTAENAWEQNFKDHTPNSTQ